ncbi:MAG TPA: hypothetical protein VMM76_18470 [Pirellulaceae bacterium]|nr:hypothetical protein [Pirellulaceae bacterium]
MTVDRTKWLHHVEEVVRSRHYSWLPSGLGGESVDVAMTFLVTDIMHICKLTGTPFEEVLTEAKKRFEAEEMRRQVEAIDPN